MEPDLNWAGHMPNAERLVHGAKRARADIVLIDIEMPGPDPFEALGDLHRRCPGVRTIVLSAHVRDHYFDAARKSGARGYVSKGDDPDDVVDAIRAVVAGKFAMSPEVAKCWGPPRSDEPREYGPRTRLSRLTQSEMEILRMVARGLSRGQIARQRHCSPKTVDNHKASIRRKLEIDGDVELSRLAIREGLVEP